MVFIAGLKYHVNTLAIVLPRHFKSHPIASPIDSRTDESLHMEEENFACCKKKTFFVLFYSFRVHNKQPKIVVYN